MMNVYNHAQGARLSKLARGYEILKMENYTVSLTIASCMYLYSWLQLASYSYILVLAIAVTV